MCVRRRKAESKPSTATASVRTAPRRRSRRSWTAADDVSSAQLYLDARTKEAGLLPMPQCVDDDRERGGDLAAARVRQVIAGEKRRPIVEDLNKVAGRQRVRCQIFRHVGDAAPGDGGLHHG